MYFCVLFFWFVFLAVDVFPDIPLYLFQLVVEDGEFLVRQSATGPGQFVLTGARRRQHKHLLLVDPNGVVSLRDIDLYLCYLIQRQMIKGN